MWGPRLRRLRTSNGLLAKVMLTAWIEKPEVHVIIQNLCFSASRWALIHTYLLPSICYAWTRRRIGRWYLGHKLWTSLLESNIFLCSSGLEAGIWVVYWPYLPGELDFLSLFDPASRPHSRKTTAPTSWTTKQGMSYLSTVGTIASH